jgi:hypothetical protein
MIYACESLQIRRYEGSTNFVQEII